MTLLELRGLLVMRPEAATDPVTPMPYRVVSLTAHRRYPDVMYAARCRDRDEAQGIAEVLRFASRVAGSARRIVVEEVAL